MDWKRKKWLATIESSSPSKSPVPAGLITISKCVLNDSFMCFANDINGSAKVCRPCVSLCAHVEMY